MRRRWQDAETLKPRSHASWERPSGSGCPGRRGSARLRCRRSPTAGHEHAVAGVELRALAIGVVHVADDPRRDPAARPGAAPGNPSAFTLNSASVSHTEPVSATPNTARTTPTSTSSRSAGARTPLERTVARDLGRRGADDLGVGKQAPDQRVRDRRRQARRRPCRPCGRARP